MTQKEKNEPAYENFVHIEMDEGDFIGIAFDSQALYVIIRALAFGFPTLSDSNQRLLIEENIVYDFFQAFKTIDPERAEELSLELQPFRVLYLLIAPYYPSDETQS